jgi:hypothetical protein
MKSRKRGTAGRVYGYRRASEVQVIRYFVCDHARNAGKDATSFEDILKRIRKIERGRQTLT